MSDQILSPYVAVKDAAAAIEFYRNAFGAEEAVRLENPSDGRIGHAEVVINGARLMLSDEFPDYGAVSAETLGGSPVKLHLYVDDVDAVFRRAVALGAKETQPVSDQFYGDRSGSLTDPFGLSWAIATKKEDVSSADLKARWDAFNKG